VNAFESKICLSGIDTPRKHSIPTLPIRKRKKKLEFIKGSISNEALQPFKEKHRT
jgi:hypothetical protein